MTGSRAVHGRRWAQRRGVPTRRGIARVLLPWVLLAWVVLAWVSLAWATLAGSPGRARADAPPEGYDDLEATTDAPTAHEPGAAEPGGVATVADDAASRELAPGRTVLLMADEADRAALEEALFLELAPRGVAVLGVDAPGGETGLERAANAQRAARFSGAVAAVWVETSSPGGGSLLRVVPADAEQPRQAPLPGPVAGIAPRTFALVAESLLDELVAPPAAPVRVRIQVQVDAPGQEVTVTTMNPAPGTVEAELDLRPATPEATPVTEPQPPAAPDFGVAPPPGAPDPIDEGVAEGEHPVVGFGADLVPMVGTSSFWRGREIRNVSLNLGGGYSYGVDGVGLAVGFNLHPGFVDGVVAATGFNVVGGAADGAMFAAGFNLVGGPANGALFAAGFNHVGGDAEAAMFAAGFNNVSGLARGAQFAAGFNAAGEGMRGVQAAAGANLAFGPMHGAQLAAGFNLATGDVSGAQVSAGVNVATGDSGGVQIGMVNISKKPDFALGIFNVFYGGRFHVEAAGDSSGFLAARVKNGGDAFHYVYSVGGRPFDEGVSTFGFGLGGHAVLGERLFLDVEGIAQVLAGDDDEAAGSGLTAQETGPRSLYSTRLSLGFRVAPKLALLAGVAYNVFVAPANHVDDGSDYAAFGGTLFSGDDPGETIARGWPSITLGVQAF